MRDQTARRLVTERDRAILFALDRAPLTVSQLLKMSRTFRQAFTNERYLRRRLQDLGASGFLRSYKYATVHPGAPNYYRLTLFGFRLLHGEKATPETRRQFSEIGIARHEHTRALAEFLVHLSVSAHERGLAIENFYRENTLRLRVGDETLFPDAAFEIRTRDGRQFNFLLELDNGTERVYSRKNADSWERKASLYNTLQDHAPMRFRVLVVTTNSKERLTRILRLAKEKALNPWRGLFLGAYLPDLLLRDDIVKAPCFVSHFGRVLPLVTPPKEFPRRSKVTTRAPREQSLELVSA